MRRTVDARETGRAPHLIWNAFIDLLAVEDYADLSPLQRKAHLVFWYEAEVLNGGHGQYFENRGRLRLRETIAALGELGLACHAQVLSRASDLFEVAARDADWSDVLPPGLPEELDGAFDSCAPDVTAALEAHLATHQAEYVDVV